MDEMDVQFGAVVLGNRRPLVLIAGLCALVDEEETLEVARDLWQWSRQRGITLIFKGSFDKANRTSLSGARGMGLERGLACLSRVKEELGLPLLTDIHEPSQVREVAPVVDLLQVPAFLCRQTDLLLAAGASGRPVVVKKGQFLAPAMMKQARDKVLAGAAQAGCAPGGVLFCERGTFFGYHDLVVDFRSLIALQQTGTPLIFDATHSVQQPGLHEEHSGGQREFVPSLARAAVAVGLAALYLEVHPDPARAPSDARTALPLQALPPLLDQWWSLDRWLKKEERERSQGGDRCR